MTLIESFRIAWGAMLTHKLRALLTMLGIIIGVGAVVGMLAIGEGYSRWIDAEFAKMGIGTLYIAPRVDSQDESENLAPRLTAADAAALLQPGRAPAVEFVAIELSRSGIVSARGERFIFGLKGVNPHFFLIGDQELGDGRYFTNEEERSGARVAVIGSTVAETLFGGIEGAVGQRININGVPFEVVGVSVTQRSNVAGAVGQFGDPGEQVFMPYRAARERLFRNDVTPQVDVSTLTVKVRDAQQMDEAIRQVTQVLREEHRLTYQSNDFRVTNPSQLASQFQAITVGFSAFLGTVGGISLLVGGIGIMNIMLVSVAQRTKEIGLRKAVGARRRDIMLQFLIEALVLCLAGGILGVVLGYLLSFLGSFVLYNLSQDPTLKASVSLFSIILATSISAGVGIFFGLFPAIRASRLDPIRALRNE
ncbi:MAG: FtsX-like permease family protein [Candidatus Viridilinea halotolerans]|uniref:FtsX-like permease family protein n=1 Tax=Candidatus Viridilinea halotolerans TaxID=2491704 RepID=A0A426UCL1_9CHLR|nr:MAG: FtsX-like permease family protein [Candidatus Viridilinea halotolerans]